MTRPFTQELFGITICDGDRTLIVLPFDSDILIEVAQRQFASGLGGLDRRVLARDRISLEKLAQRQRTRGDRGLQFGLGPAVPAGFRL